MLNECVVVGRIRNIRQTKNENNPEIKVTLDVKRSEINDQGEYETDSLPFFLPNELAQTVLEACKIGDLIGVKGKIERRGPNICLIGKKVTFLSIKKKEE